jgi:hypothetical protein
VNCGRVVGRMWAVVDPSCGNVWRDVVPQYSATIKVPNCGKSGHKSPQLAHNSPHNPHNNYGKLWVSCGGLCGDTNQRGSLVVVCCLPEMAQYREPPGCLPIQNTADTQQAHTEVPKHHKHGTQPRLRSQQPFSSSSETKPQIGTSNRAVNSCSTAPEALLSQRIGHVCTTGKQNSLRNTRAFGNERLH